MINLENKQLLIFDCDGVLFDSAVANIAYFNTCLEMLKMPPLTAEMETRAVYMSVHQLFLELLQDPSAADEAFSLSQSLPYDPFLPMLKPLFDFQAVLSELRNRYFLALASNRSKSLSKVVRHYNLFNFFHFKISALDTKPKPAPDMLIACINYFDVQPHQAVFIGDSISDARAAENASIQYMHVGHHDSYPCIISVEQLIKIP